MHRNVFGVLLLLSACSATLTRAEPPAPADILPPALPSPPVYWHLSSSQPPAAGRGYLVALDHGIVHSGRGSGRLESLPDPAIADGSLAQWARSDGFRGKTICFSAWLRSRDVIGWGGLWFRADDAQGNVLAFQNARTRRSGTNAPLQGSSDWHEVELYIDVPANTAALAFGVQLIGPGSVWIDDAALGVLGPAAAVEVTLTPVLAHNRPPPLDRLTVPRNLDFEE